MEARLLAARFLLLLLCGPGLAAAAPAVTLARSAPASRCQWRWRIRATLRDVSSWSEGRGKIIDDEKEVSAYPKHKATRAPFVEAEWDLATMEPRSGRYPGPKAPEL